MLFVTGSTSSLLAGELASRLSGRTIEFHINPFSFAECLEYTGEDADKLFDDYLKWGGFPLRFNSKSGSRMYAGDLYQGILKRDIFNRHDLASQQSFRNFCSYVMSRSGEVDFVVSDRKDALAYIQVCYLLSDDSVIEREFGAYGCVKDNFPKYVISCDKVDLSRGGIKHLNILDFLTKPVFAF